MGLKPREQQLDMSDMAAQRTLNKYRNHPLLRIKSKFPFEQFRVILEPLYHQMGRPGFDPVKMLCLLILGKLQNLSDKRLETDVAVNLLYREFCGWSMDEDTPDHSTISRFRDRIAPAWPKVWATMVAWLVEEGLVDNELIIIDATDIKAQGRYRKPQDSDKMAPDDKYKEQTDPDARHGHKRKDKPFYGFKAHVVVDSKAKMITKIEVTPGNAHDGVIMRELVRDLLFKPKEATADKLYWSLKNAGFLDSLGIENGIIPKGIEGWPVKASHRLRKLIERINSLLKCVCGLFRTRFFGLLNVDLDTKLAGFAVNLVNLLRFA
jgi:transposase, IS5 family